MRRFVLLFAVLMSTFSVLPGCGSGSAPSPADQKKVQAESQANMQKGMEAMKAMKGGVKK